MSTTKQKPKKPLSPLEALAKDIGNTYQKDIESVFDASEVIEINPSEVKNWAYSDRLEFDLGDIEKLANDIKINGQIVPIIVRKSDRDDCKYEVIAGERRCKAAELADLNIKAIIRNLTDYDAALLQSSENSQRKDLSDYSKGMSLWKLVKNKVISKTDLASKLGLPNNVITRLLSFGEIPESIWDAIGNPTKVTSRTAGEINALAKLGKQHINILISLAKEISTGKLGASNLRKEFDKHFHDAPQESKIKNNVLRSKSGDTVMKWNINKKNLIVSIPLSQLDKQGHESLINIIKETITQTNG